MHQPVFPKYVRFLKCGSNAVRLTSINGKYATGLSISLLNFILHRNIHRYFSRISDTWFSKWFKMMPVSRVRWCQTNHIFRWIRSTQYTVRCNRIKVYKQQVWWKPGWSLVSKFDESGVEQGKHFCNMRRYVFFCNRNKDDMIVAVMRCRPMNFRTSSWRPRIRNRLWG